MSTQLVVAGTPWHGLMHKPRVLSVASLHHVPQFRTGSGLARGGGDTYAYNFRRHSLSGMQVLMAYLPHLGPSFDCSALPRGTITLQNAPKKKKMLLSANKFKKFCIINTLLRNLCDNETIITLAMKEICFSLPKPAFSKLFADFFFFFRKEFVLTSHKHALEVSGLDYVNMAQRTLKWMPPWNIIVVLLTLNNFPLQPPMR